MLKEFQEHSDTPQPSSQIELKHAIYRENILFAYANRPILQNLTCTIPINTTTAITGESGVGKSTLADLILGLLHPQSGTIRIDETPVKGMSLNDAVKRMRGKPNTQIVLTIARKGEPQPLVITLTRAEIRETFAAFCAARPVGGKFAHRATDAPACSSPSMKWVNPPVAFMLHAGVPPLLVSELVNKNLARTGVDYGALLAPVLAR